MNGRQILRARVLHPSAGGWRLLLFLFLLLPNLAVILFCDELTLAKRLGSLLIALYLWVLPATLLQARTYFKWMGLFPLPAPIEIGCAVVNQTPLTLGVVSSFFNTTQAETVEFISLFSIFLPLVLAYWCGYFWLVRKKVENRPLFTPLGKYLIWITFLCFNVGMWSRIYWITSPVKQDHWGTLQETNDSFWKKYEGVYPYNISYFCYKIYENDRKIRRMQASLGDFRFGAVSRDTLSQPKIFVLVIGESARYDHFGINGYQRPTTPLLEQTDHLYSFHNVLACANLTEFVLPFMLTRATLQHPDLQFEEKALPDAFQEAGYFTAWIANQGDNYPFIQRIAQDADVSEFLTTAFNASDSQDEYLLPLLEEILAHDARQKLIVIHTHGSHFQYDMRYPAAFEHYKPNMNRQKRLDRSEAGLQRLVNSYDNTILYTDYILSQIIQRLEQQQAISALVYLSDHAESLYDLPARQVLHGNTKPAVSELHIPLLVWLSDAYEQTYPEKVTQLRQQLDKRLSTTNLFDSFLDLANIHYPDEQLGQSFVSPLFHEDSVRYVLTPDQRIITLK